MKKRSIFDAPISPQMYGHSANESAWRDKAKSDPRIAKILEERSKIRGNVFNWLRQAGMYFEIIGGFDEDSAVRIYSTVTEVEADLVTKIGPDRKRVAEYVNMTPRLVIDGIDIAPLCRSFNVQVTRNGNNPLVITPQILPGEIDIPNEDK